MQKEAAVHRSCLCFRNPNNNNNDDADDEANIKKGTFGKSVIQYQGQNPTVGFWLGCGWDHGTGNHEAGADSAISEIRCKVDRGEQLQVMHAWGLGR